MTRKNRPRSSHSRSAAILRRLEKKYIERPGELTKNELKALRYYRNLVRATPKWITLEQRQEINRIYRCAKAQKLVVDHIVPLSSPLVCGLNVPWNLQVTSKEENDKKSNKWWPGAPFEQTGLEFEPQIALFIESLPQ